MARWRDSSSGGAGIHAARRGWPLAHRRSKLSHPLQRDRFTAESYPLPFDHVRSNVLPARERKAEEGKDAAGKVRPHHKAFLAHWWRLSFGRPEMLSVITPLPRYLACSYVTKRPIFFFVSSAIRPSNLIQVFGFADDYSFGMAAR